jgi:hypothetical protein
MKTEPKYYQRPSTHDPQIFRHSPPERVKSIRLIVQALALDSQTNNSVSIPLLSTPKFYTLCKKYGVRPANARRIFKGVV